MNATSGSAYSLPQDEAVLLALAAGLEIFTNMGKEISPEKRLKEFVGHTPLQVLMGAILGIAIAVILGIWM